MPLTVNGPFVTGWFQSPPAIITILIVALNFGWMIALSASSITPTWSDGFVEYI